MRMAERIERKLTEALKAGAVEVVDESHLHKGHAGARPEGESHFRVRVISPEFEGLSRVARQRRVFEILSEELAGPVHALSLTTLTPAEAEEGG